MQIDTLFWLFQQVFSAQGYDLVGTSITQVQRICVRPHPAHTDNQI